RGLFADRDHLRIAAGDGAAAGRNMDADDVRRLVARLRQVQLLPVSDSPARDALDPGVRVRSWRLRDAGAVDRTGAVLCCRYSARVRISVVVVALLRGADSFAQEELWVLRT